MADSGWLMADGAKTAPNRLWQVEGGKWKVKEDFPLSTFHL
jgi:hypothetical protein